MLHSFNWRAESAVKRQSQSINVASKIVSDFMTYVGWDFEPEPRTRHAHYNRKNYTLYTVTKLLFS